MKALNQMYRKKYYDARHVCYAYRLGAGGEEFRANDDGEPSSTAGKPILGVLLSEDVTDVVIFVIRYYGGVNLGTGGLIVAYREAAHDAMNNAEKTERLVDPQMNAVMRIVKDMNARIIAQDFQTTCTITLSIRKSQASLLRQRLDSINFA